MSIMFYNIGKYCKNCHNSETIVIIFLNFLLFTSHWIVNQLCTMQISNLYVNLVY